MFDLGFWVGLAALILALPPALQKYFGTPKIKLKFQTVIVERNYALDCIISNVPVRSKLLKSFGVTRVAADIRAYFQIFEAGTERVISEACRALIDDRTGDIGERARIPGGFEATARLIFADHNTGQTSILNNRRQINLAPGIYDLAITIVVSGKNVTDKHRFYVTGTAEELHWESPPPNA
jgi:hypothetical protein